MRAESTVKPPVSLKFTIEELGYGKCNVHMYENIEETTTVVGDTIYTYDVYILKDIPYHENLKENIKSKKAAWLAMAKAAEESNENKIEIANLKEELKKYDYIGVKIATGVATKEEYSDKIAYCESLRGRIRSLEAAEENDA